MNLTVIILAAGKGSRMKSLNKEYSKVAYPILGTPVVEYVLNAVKGVKPKEIITVVGHGGEATKKIVLKNSKVVWQKEQKGTGHAVIQAKKYIKNIKGEMTLVLCGDTPLIQSETLKDLIHYHIKHKNEQTLLSAIVNNPHGYGRIVRDTTGNLIRVVEQTDTTIEEAKINEVNTGVAIFNNVALLKGLAKLSNNNAKGEYYLTELISIFLKNDLKVGAKVMENPEEMDGINDRYQLYQARKKLQTRINKTHLLNGVSVQDIDTIHIGPYVAILNDTIIEPNVIIMGNSKIGKGVFIGANSYIQDANIKDNEIIEPFTYIKNNKRIK